MIEAFLGVYAMGDRIDYLMLFIDSTFFKDFLSFYFYYGFVGGEAI
jgi:hypothetical protein